MYNSWTSPVCVINQVIKLLSLHIPHHIHTHFGVSIYTFIWERKMLIIILKATGFYFSCLLIFLVVSCHLIITYIYTMRMKCSKINELLLLGFRNMENSGLASWKRPVLLVKGPLGIVSWIELSFLNHVYMACLPMSPNRAAHEVEYAKKFIKQKNHVIWVVSTRHVGQACWVSLPGS